MAVTTEPPWLHKTVGVAPKNGTNSHTITFASFGDAPFTPADGSLLTLWVHGAVTNAVSGWTKQAGPIATGELSLFTKVCAGDTSATITHNGSNYAVVVALVEYPAGSTPNGVDSTTGSNDTAVPLSGLPGTAQVVVSGLGRVPIGSETGASITPSAPWVEVADLFVAPAGGTDGAYLAVVHQINVTTTSINPVISPSYSGTWGNGSREKISFVINAEPPPAGTTPFTKDWSTTWSVRNAWTKDWSTTWRVSTSFTKDWADTWRIRNAFAKDWVTSWQVRNSWTKDYATSWRVSNAWSADWLTSWAIRNAFTKDYATSWNISEAVGWTKDWADTWRVRNVWSADYATSWRVLNPWEKDWVTSWNLLEDTSWIKDYADGWRIRNGFLRDYVTTWRILSDILPPPLPADVTVDLTDVISVYLHEPTVIVRLP